jgi:hypothetical protein
MQGTVLVDVPFPDEPPLEQFSARIGELRAGRSGASSAAFSKTILCTIMVSGLRNMAAKPSG